MKKRTIKRLAVCSAAFLAVTLCGFYCVSLQSTPACDACERIRLGMTEKEVEAILGSYGDGTFMPGPRMSGGRLDGWIQEWYADDGVLFLDYQMDPEPKIVLKKYFSPSDAPGWHKPTFFERLRSSLGW
jgi:hypothetical protein